MANAIQRIVIGDEPDAWRGAGFTVVGNELTLGKVVIELAGVESGRGVLGWSIAGVTGEIDGLPMCSTTSEAMAIPSERRSASTNAVFAIDHVVVETNDMDRTISAFAAVGMAERRSATMSTHMGDRRQSFLWAGRVIIEVIGPVEGKESGQSTGTASIWGLALVSSNLQTTAHVLDDKLSEPRDAVQPGRKIATVRTKELDISVPLVVMSPHVAELL